MNPVTKTRHGTWNLIFDTQFPWISYFCIKDHVSKQDGLFWGNPVTSVITQPTLKHFSSTHGLTKTTSKSRPNHRETKYKFDKQGGGVQNSYLFTHFICIFFTMQVLNQNMNASVFVVLCGYTIQSLQILFQ